MQKCVVMDASSVIRKVTKRILTGEGMMVTDADNGAQVLAMASKELPDYVIVDAGVADFDFEDLLRKLRKLDRTGKMKITACMSEVDLVAMTRAKRAGADDFLLKPFDRKLLLAQFNAMDRAA